MNVGRLLHIAKNPENTLRIPDRYRTGRWIKIAPREFAGRVTAVYLEIQGTMVRENIIVSWDAALVLHIRSVAIEL